MRANSSSFRKRLFFIVLGSGLAPTTMDRLGPGGLLLETFRIDYQFDLRFNFNDPEPQNVSIESAEPFWV